MTVAISLDLRSAAFSDGFPIPKEYTADGSNSSPPLTWGDPPDGTKGFALLLDDPDAPRGIFTHWILFNLPADVRDLPPAVPQTPSLANGARQGTNSGGRIGYMGPSPPPGPAHRYFFKLYALDSMLGLEAGADKEQFLNALKDHKLAEGRLIGVYGREKT